MDWEAAFILITYIGIGIVWTRDALRFNKQKMAGCDHTKTHTFRLYGFPLPHHGSAVKKCEKCGKQWNLYQPGAPFPKYKEEYDVETYWREREYAQRKKEYDNEQSAKNERSS